MAGPVVQGDTESATDEQAAAGLVRAIRRAYQSPTAYGGVEAFHVANLHEFAGRLVAEGVRALSEEA